MGSAAALAAACAPAAAPAPAAPAAEAPKPAAAAATEAPKPTEAPAAEAKPTEAPAAPAVELSPVDRADTLFLGWGTVDAVGVNNPWATGYTHQHGSNFSWEPLFYFAIFADKELPWIAESGEYNADFTELTVKLRKEAAWSDGTPITADDVVFTLTGQQTNEKLQYHANVKKFMKSVEKVDAQTAKLTFTEPQPRFKFEILTLKFDTGIPMVPAHILSKEADPTAFKGQDMPISGAYKIVSWTPDQIVRDYREDWWAVKAGIATAPDVKRVVVQKIGADMGTVAQRVVNNEFDSALDFRNDIVAKIVQENPKVTTHTGADEPHGYLDWWPNSLWMNHKNEPVNDPNIRRAIALTINRDQIDEVVYNGAKVTNVYPFPLYPGLEKFAATTKELQDKYQPRKFDLEESAKLFEAAGFAKNGDGLWEKDGKTVPGIIYGFEGIHADIVPVLVEQLRAGGIDSSVGFGPDAWQNMSDGKPGFFMFGHGASLLDPYAAFELFHSRNSNPTGVSSGNARWSRYENPEYDAIIDAMAPLPADDPKYQENALKAMEIYWRDTIDIPIIQWLHRIAYNQTYWTNWPTAANLGPGCNGAFWAHTGHLVVTNLKKAG
jgi:ABC-type transport system substrate-binding protein